QIRIFLSQIKTIISQIADNNPIDITTIKDKSNLISLLDNSQSNPTNSPQTIQSLFEEQVYKTPDNIALVYKDITLTYKQMNQQANIIANYLIDNYKTKPDDLISLLLDRSENMIIAILGVLKSGAGYVPISPSNPKERVDYIIKDTNSVLLLDDKIVDKILKDNSNISNPITKTTPDNLAYVIYTSGTTGRPKGVMVEHKGVGNLVQSLHTQYNLSNKPQEETILFLSNYVFDASVGQIFLSLLYSHKLIITEDKAYEDAGNLLKYIEDNKITHIHTTPSMLKLINIHKSKSIKRIMVGGECLSEDIINKHTNKPYTLINIYGPTESTDITTTYIYNKQDKENIIGHPIDNTSIYLLDNNLNIVPKGAIGEIHIGGVGLSRGYINNKTLTKQKFISNPYQTKQEKTSNINNKLYKTGDLARINKDNQIEFIGRSDDQVKIRGFRIELGEIDNTIQGIENVSKSITIAKNKQLISYYLGDIKEAQIRDKLNNVLPDFMIPSFIVKLDELPLNENGKINRNKLPKITVDKKHDYQKPLTKLEISLTHILSELLSIDENKISVGDDFFYLGLDSIKAIQFANTINKEYNNKIISVRDIFKYKTVKALSENFNHVTNYKIEKVNSINKVLITPQQYSFYKFGSGSVSFYIKFDKRGNVHKLRNALIKTIDLNYYIKTTFEMSNGKIYQKRNENLVVNIPIHEKKVTDEIKENFIENFDLFGDQLFKFEFYYFNGEISLLMNVHHILIDNISADIFFDDLFKLYDEDNIIDDLMKDREFDYFDYSFYLLDNKKEMEEKSNNYFEDKTKRFNLTYLNNDSSNNKIQNISQEMNLKEEINFKVFTFNEKDLKVFAKKYNSSISNIILSVIVFSLSKLLKTEDILINSIFNGRINPKYYNTFGYLVYNLFLFLNTNHENYGDYLDNINEQINLAIENYSPYINFNLVKKFINPLFNYNYMKIYSNKMFFKESLNFKESLDNIKHSKNSENENSLQQTYFLSLVVDSKVVLYVYSNYFTNDQFGKLIENIILLLEEFGIKNY
ncbi:MAG: amino acid adenylation domain-containing protein, partial [Methanobrevibacter sp.]|nr:amino acid adenylation domain-containing protein [Candidatus Methanovirga meridionalis]